MATKLEKTSDGLVFHIRRREAWTSYRKSFDGAWSMTHDRRKWTPINAITVPAAALRAVAGAAHRGEIAMIREMQR